MPICIAIAVPEGIILASDSQTTWLQTVEKGIQKDTKQQFDLDVPIAIPLSSSKMSRKPFLIIVAGNSYAFCVTGAMMVNQKNTRLLFKMLEKSYQGDGSYEHVLRYFIEGIKAHLKEQLGIRNLSESSLIINVDFIICGYMNKDIFKPRIESWSVFSGRPRFETGEFLETGELRKFSNVEDGKYSYGGCWIGRTEFISHILSHNSQILPPIHVQFDIFSLKDGIDFVQFLIEFVCNYQRFAIMVPDCGKPVVTAILTTDGFTEEINAN